MTPLPVEQHLTSQLYFVGSQTLSYNKRVVSVMAIPQRMGRMEHGLRISDCPVNYSRQGFHAWATLKRRSMGTRRRVVIK
jgi:hypothetical protein